MEAVAECGSESIHPGFSFWSRAVYAIKNWMVVKAWEWGYEVVTNSFGFCDKTCTFPQSTIHLPRSVTGAHHSTNRVDKCAHGVCLMWLTLKCCLRWERYWGTGRRPSGPSSSLFWCRATRNATTGERWTPQLMLTVYPHHPPHSGTSIYIDRYT